MGWGVPFPTEEGVWGGGGAPSPEIFLIFLVQCVQKIFAFRPSGGGGHRSVPPGLKYATAAAVSGQFWRVSATLALAACMICHIIPLVTGCITY